MKRIQLIVYIFSIFLIVNNDIFPQVTITSPSPTDGDTLVNPPTFKFSTTVNGCYVFVITSSQNGCTQNSGVWNSSLSLMYRGNSYETTVPQSVWNSLADGTTYWWHISYRLVDCPNLPLPYHSECRRFIKVNLPSGFNDGEHNFKDTKNFHFELTDNNIRITFLSNYVSEKFSIAIYNIIFEIVDFRSFDLSQYQNNNLLTIEYPLPRLKPGVYYCVLNIKNFLFHQKFIRLP
ncbi:MAG: hypothetical protein N2560_05655 [Ignavibacteria bacterium]|nr:hypothetical protein [Ignavibacteria bacterium]